MIRIEKLKPFTFYRLSSKLLMYENTKNPKKYTMISVLAPSIEEEMKYLNNIGDIINIRYLYKYFIEKITKHRFYGRGETKTINDILPIQEYITKNNTKGNLKNLNSFVSPNINSKTDLLKGLNFLYEINHITNEVLNNPKDLRIPSVIAEDVLKTLEMYLQDQVINYNMHIYDRKVLFIPIDLWADIKDYRSSKFFTKTNKNIISMLYNKLILEPDTIKIFKDYNIILTNNNEIMVINVNDLINPVKDANLQTFDYYIREFMKKCKSSSDEVSQELVSEELEKELTTAEVETEASLELENVLEKSKINLENIDSEKREELTNIIKTEIEEKGSFDIDTSQIKAVKKNEDIDIFLKARMSGQSIENFKRNEILKEKYKSLKFNDRTIEDILKDGEKYTIPSYEIKANVINPELKNIKSFNFEKSYNDQLFNYDLMNILLHFNNTSPALYMISDPIIEDISDTMNKLYKVTVEYEDENRKRHKFSFQMPKFYKDRYLFINENKKDIIHQKFPYPITKTSPNMVQVCSNYNKIFIERYGANISPKVTKLKKILTGDSVPNNVKVYRGDASGMNSSLLTTIEYDELSSSIYKMNIGNVVIYFSAPDAVMMTGENVSDTKIPLAMDNKTKMIYYISGIDNKITDSKGKDYGELSDFIINLISEKDKSFEEKFSDVSAGTKYIYSRATMMAHDIPLILVLTSVAKDGLREILERAKIVYEFNESKKNIDTDNKGVIPFADGYLIYDRYPYDNSILLNGLSVLPTKEYNFNDMNNRETYVDIYDTIYHKRNLIEGVENFNQLMIDPITLDVLRRLNLPLNFIDVMLYANGLLADNSFKLDSSYDQTRLRSNEIVLAILYQLLSQQYGLFRTGKAAKFSIPEEALIKELLSSHIIDEHSVLNTVLELENDRLVKMKGPSGMNVDEAYTLEKRAYHPTMKGIVAMNSTASGEVGVKRQLSLNYNVLDARGFVEINKDSYDGTEIMSPGELLNVFAVESSDPERVAMTITQSKHLVPTEKMDSSLVSYDMERVVPYLSSDFSYVAKDNGQVVDIKNNVMIVKYSNGDYDDIDLESMPAKNSNGGFFIMNNLISKYKIGDKFDKGEILAYNPKYITDEDNFGDTVMCNGTLARIAVVANGSTYEDSTYITDKLAHDLATKITIKKDIIISKYSNISYMVEKGQEISVNDPLIVFDDTKDEFTSKLLVSIAEEAEDSDHIVASNAPIVSKVSGRVADIRIYYTVPFDEMTPSLKKVISAYNKGVSDREKLITKYMDIKDSNTVLTPSIQVEPDSAGRIKGIKVGEGIFIEFYIEYLDIMGVGDKLAHYTALKGIVNDIIPIGLEAYGTFNPDRKVQAFLSTIGVYKRMTHDINKVLGITKILIEKKRLMKNKYLDKIKSELK